MIRKLSAIKLCSTPRLPATHPTTTTTVAGSSTPSKLYPADIHITPSSSSGEDSSFSFSSSASETDFRRAGRTLRTGTRRRVSVSSRRMVSPLVSGASGSGSSSEADPLLLNTPPESIILDKYEEEADKEVDIVSIGVVAGDDVDSEGQGMTTKGSMKEEKAEASMSSSEDSSPDPLFLFNENSKEADEEEEGYNEGELKPMGMTTTLRKFSPVLPSPSPIEPAEQSSLESSDEEFLFSSEEKKDEEEEEMLFNKFVNRVDKHGVWGEGGNHNDNTHDMDEEGDDDYETHEPSEQELSYSSDSIISGGEPSEQHTSTTTTATSIVAPTTTGPADSYLNVVLISDDSDVEVQVHEKPGTKPPQKGPSVIGISSAAAPSISSTTAAGEAPPRRCKYRLRSRNPIKGDDEKKKKKKKGKVSRARKGSEQANGMRRRLVLITKKKRMM